MSRIHSQTYSCFQEIILTWNSLEYIGYLRLFWINFENGCSNYYFVMVHNFLASAGFPNMESPKYGIFSFIIQSISYITSFSEFSSLLLPLHFLFALLGTSFKSSLFSIHPWNLCPHVVLPRAILRDFRLLQPYHQQSTALALQSAS